MKNFLEIGTKLEYVLQKIYVYIQSWSHANGRFPVYEAKVLFSQGRGRM